MRGLRNSVLFVVLLSCLMACDMSTLYHHFEEIPSEGWDKEDTLNFSIDTLTQSGTYTLSLQMRTSDIYPYQNVSLYVEEEVFPAKVHRAFNVSFRTRKENGEFMGPGMSQHDLTKVLTCQYLHHGDSIHLKVYHRMRRLLLPGITDVGIKLEK